MYLEFTPAMMANSLDPVLAFKCRLEKSHDEVIQCRTAIDRLISSNAEHSHVGSKDYVKRCWLIDEKTFTMVTEVGKLISLFESKSSRRSKSSHTNSRSSYTSRSSKSCSFEEKDIILKYQLDMNRLAMRREDEHSNAARVELENAESTNNEMEDNVFVCNSEQAHLKGGVHHTNGVASTNLKGEDTNVKFVDSPVHVNTSTLKVDAIPYTCKSDEERHNNCVRLPLPKPQTFAGRSLEFPQWQVAFETLMSQADVNDTQRFYYLRDSLSSPALECINDMVLLDPQHAYPLAMTRLKERFGNPSVIANAYYEKLSSWPRITDNDNNALRKYSDFLQQCCVAQDLYSSLRILDHEKENCLIISKLPDKLVYRWMRGVSDHRHSFGEFPTLKTFAIFLQRKSDIACDPVLSMQTVSSVRKHCMSNKSSD